MVSLHRTWTFGHWRQAMRWAVWVFLVLAEGVLLPEKVRPKNHGKTPGMLKKLPSNRIKISISVVK